MGREPLTRSGEHIRASVAVGSLSGGNGEGEGHETNLHSTYALLVASTHTLSAYEMHADSIERGGTGCVFSVPIDSVLAAHLDETAGTDIQLRIHFSGRKPISAYIPRSQLARAQELVRVLTRHTSP
jgi:hypothetical protein